MARFLYLVTAHSNPYQVARLVRALLRASPEGQVLLHWDAEAGPLPADEFANQPRVAVYPTPHVIRWGDFSIVDTVLEMAAWALRRMPFDWLVWISGQDYPLGPLQRFESELVNGRADGWFRHFSAFAHQAWPVNEGLRRYAFRYTSVSSIPRFYWLPASVRKVVDVGLKRFNHAQNLLQLRPRHRNNPAQIGLRVWQTPYTPQRPCMAGWTWLNLNARAVERMLAFAAEHPEFVAHYRRTYCPDESFFHTILLNNPDLLIENDPLRHVSWEDRPYSSNPRVIVRGPAFDAALASGKPFARKFDIKVDAGCLDELDARIAAG